MIRILVLMDMPLFPYRIYAYNELADRGYDLTVCSMSNKDAEYPIDLKFRHIRSSYVKFGCFVWLKSLSEVNYEKYDYIIVTPNLRVLNLYHLYGKKYREKLLAWGHLKGCTTGNKIAAIIRTAICRKMKALIFYDTGTRNDFVKMGFDKKKLFVANNTQYVNPDTIHLEREKLYFLYVGRIQKRKSIDIAIKAFAEFRRKNPTSSVSLKIVGEGDTNALKTLAYNLKIDNYVSFEGPVHEEGALGNLFSQAIAYVSPGHVGLGVLHSLAFGVPVITCSERLHSVEISNCKADNSMIVPYSALDVADAMNTLFNNSDLHHKMSLAAHSYYERYCTIDKMVDGIDDAIKYCIKSN